MRPFESILLTDIDDVSFEECFRNRKEVSIDNLIVNFIGYEDLLKNKKESGRPRDIDDIDHLKQIRRTTMHLQDTALDMPSALP